MSKGTKKPKTAVERLTEAREAALRKALAREARVSLRRLAAK